MRRQALDVVRLWWALSVALCGVAGSAVAEGQAEAPPADLPDTTESAKLSARMPKTVSGQVTVDGKGAAGIRVTDGIDFVTTDAEGKYTLPIRPDPVLPYVPSRTVSVCWPTGTWPAHDGWSGRWAWWARLKDVVKVQPDQPAPETVDGVNFRLVSQPQSLPICVAHGTDPHDAMLRTQNYMFRDEIAAAKGHVSFAVMTGDLHYIGFGNADSAYTTIEQFANHFPVPMLTTIGNHDIVGVHSKWWSIPHELAGNGAFTKYLGPIRWSFDYAGVHFAALDFLGIDAEGKINADEPCKEAVAWLDKDLDAVPAGTPIYFFNHLPGNLGEDFHRVAARHKVKLALGGHAHRDMFLGARDGVDYWAKMSLYTLIYIDKDGYEFVDRNDYGGGRGAWDSRWDPYDVGLGGEAVPGRQHQELSDFELAGKARKLKTVDGGTYDIRIGARGTGDPPARAWGLRLTGQDGKVLEFRYDDLAKEVTLMGRRTFFDPWLPHIEIVHPARVEERKPENQTWVEMRVFVMPDRVRVLVNHRLHYEKYIKPGAAKEIEVFAEDGAAAFARADVWQHAWKDYAPKRSLAGE